MRRRTSAFEWVMLAVAVACGWGVVIGAAIAITAPNGFPGVVLACLSGFVGWGAISEAIERSAQLDRRAMEEDERRWSELLR